MKKIVSLVLTLAIVMMSMAILPVSVSAASSLPVSDDFNGESIDFAKWNSSNAANLSLESGAIKLSGSNPAALGFTLDTPVSTGKVNIKYDYFFPESNTTSAKMWLYGGNGTGDADSITNQGPTVMTFTYTGGKSVVVPKRGVWYNVDLTLDCETKEISATVTSKDSGLSYQNIVTSGAPNLVPIKQVHFGTKDMGATDYILVDNISITQPEPVVHELPVEDDFSGTAIDTVKWNATNTANATLVDRDAATGDKAVKIHNLYNGAVFGVKLDEAITEGEINIKYDMYLPAGSVDATTGKFKGEFLIYGGTEVADTSAIT